MSSRANFPLIDDYLGIRLDLDMSVLEPGRIAVSETDKRLAAEKSFGYIRALWVISFEDGRADMSVTPGAGGGVAEMAQGISSAEALLDLARKLKMSVDRALARNGLRPTDRALQDMWFACNGLLLRPHSRGDCKQLRDASVPPAEGISLPLQCFPGGVAYGIIVEGKVVSVAGAHRTGVLEEKVAELGVVTAPAWRRRGYAKTAVPTIVQHFAHDGGEVCYPCEPGNLASAATARSVGFALYGRSLILSSPAS